MPKKKRKATRAPLIWEKEESELIVTELSREGLPWTKKTLIKLDLLTKLANLSVNVGRGERSIEAVLSHGTKVLGLSRCRTFNAQGEVVQVPGIAPKKYKEKPSTWTPEKKDFLRDLLYRHYPSWETQRITMKMSAHLTLLLNARFNPVYSYEYSEEAIKTIIVHLQNKAGKRPKKPQKRSAPASLPTKTPIQESLGYALAQPLQLVIPLNERKVPGQHISVLISEKAMGRLKEMTKGAMIKSGDSVHFLLSGIIEATWNIVAALGPTRTADLARFTDYDTAFKRILSIYAHFKQNSPMAASTIPSTSVNSLRIKNQEVVTGLMRSKRCGNTAAEVVQAALALLIQKIVEEFDMEANKIKQKGIEGKEKARKTKERAVQIEKEAEVALKLAAITKRKAILLRDLTKKD